MRGLWRWGALDLLGDTRAWMGIFFWGPLAERAERGTKAGAGRVSWSDGETGMIRGGGKFEMEE